jgi:hypothetical protein
VEINQNSTLDTTSYLNQGDIEAISKLSNIKKDITSYFDMDLLIGKMRDIIDESKHFDFRSENARKFIDKEQPAFILKYISEEIKTGLEQYRDVSDQVDFVTSAVAGDVIAKFSRFVTDCIKDSSKLNDLFSELPKDLTEFFISNIYTVRVSVKENNIHVLYFI